MEVGQADTTMVETEGITKEVTTRVVVEEEEEEVVVEEAVAMEEMVMRAMAMVSVN